MKISELKTFINEGKIDDKLVELYGEKALDAQKERYIAILDNALHAFSDEEARIYSAPGRTEIGGNHTDHQLGKVLAASLNLDVVACVIPTDDNIVTYASKGYNVKPVDVSDITIHEEEKNCKTVCYGRRYDAACGVYGHSRQRRRKQCVRRH